MFFTIEESKARIAESVDRFGDSFARDVTTEELKEVEPLSASIQTRHTDQSLDLHLDAKPSKGRIAFELQNRATGTRS